MLVPELTPDIFIASVASGIKPPSLTPALQSLWFAARGDWEEAHHIAQNMDSPAGAHIHAYLHRVGGDESNARYWYRKAGVPFPDCSVDEEWESIMKLQFAG